MVVSDYYLATIYELLWGCLNMSQPKNCRTRYILTTYMKSSSFLGVIKVSSKYLLIKCRLISEGIFTLALLHSSKNVRNHIFSTFDSKLRTVISRIFLSMGPK